MKQPEIQTTTISGNGHVVTTPTNSTYVIDNIIPIKNKPMANEKLKLKILDKLINGLDKVNASLKETLKSAKSVNKKIEKRPKNKK